MSIEEIDDQELIRRFYQADEDALKMIFKRYKDSLFNFSLRYTGNRADAEDAVSHTFMMLCEKRYVVKEGASFKTWAYTVARNLCLTKLRSQRKLYSLWFTKNDSEEKQSIEIADHGPIARDLLHDKELSQIIQKAINKLPSEQRQALLLKEYHGFSYQEIVQVLDCSLEKVKVLIFRARAFLKEVLPPLLKEGR